MYYCWHVASHLFLNLLLTWKKKRSNICSTTERLFPPPTVKFACCFFGTWGIDHLGKLLMQLNLFAKYLYSLSLVYSQLKFSGFFVFFPPSFWLLYFYQWLHHYWRDFQSKMEWHPALGFLAFSCFVSNSQLLLLGGDLTEAMTEHSTFSNELRLTDKRQSKGTAVSSFLLHRRAICSVSVIIRRNFGPFTLGAANKIVSPPHSTAHCLDKVCICSQWPNDTPTWLTENLPLSHTESNAANFK